MSPHRFSTWLSEFLPVLKDSSNWLVPAIVTDRSDPKLAHLDGLNLSRAWMMEGIASGLPEADMRIPTLLAGAKAHEAEGLIGLNSGYYEGGHWLGSFATYLVTRRGIP